MCGLAGSFHPASDEEDPWVAEALDLIAHRGPDARGVQTWTAATHGHVRLSILDLDARSNQPFVYRGVLLSYNGECWNYRLLRAQLEFEGYEFRTEGDTEVVAALLDQAISQDRSPAAALAAMEGQFALAVTESCSGQTWLARDRLGEVPLYWLEDEAEVSLFVSSDARVRWASERKAFKRRGAEATPVPAGCYMQLPDGVPKDYWSVPARVMTDWDAPYPAEVLELIKDAVWQRLQSDVPVAFLASGGLDSSLILSIVKDLQDEVVAYTAELPGRPNPDADAARQICEELGVELRVVTVDPVGTDYWLEDTIRAIEIPMKAQVEIGWPCLALARRIAADGFKVVLSGEGADELFGGYGTQARKSGSDREWMEVRRASVEKMARGNCIRTNKAFMAHGVEARLPFVDYRLVERVLPTSVKECPPGKGLLKQAAMLAGLPAWVIDQRKRTFQGAVGTLADADALYGGDQIKTYNRVARELFGGIPRG